MAVQWAANQTLYCLSDKGEEDRRWGGEQREMSFLPGGGPRHQLRPGRGRGLGRNAVHVAVAVEVHLVEEVSSVH